MDVLTDYIVVIVSQYISETYTTCQLHLNKAGGKVFKKTDVNKRVPRVSPSGAGYGVY